MDTSLDEMYADIKALVSRWEEDAARLVNRRLDEDRANGIKTLADLKKSYAKQIRLSKKKGYKENKNSGNVETVLTESQKAAFLLMEIGSKCSSRILIRGKLGRCPCGWSVVPRHYRTKEYIVLEVLYEHCV